MKSTPVQIRDVGFCSFFFATRTAHGRRSQRAPDTHRRTHQTRHASNIARTLLGNRSSHAGGTDRRFRTGQRLHPADERPKMAT